MRPDLRDRLLLPVLLPVGIVVLIGGALWGFSRILLGVTATAATVTALVVALGIVVTAAVAAGRSTIRGSTIAAMFGATVGAAMLAGGISLAVVGGGGEEGEEHPEPGGGPVVDVVAAALEFDPTTLRVPAGARFTIAFDNQDAGVQHNVDIFENAELTGEALFEGELVTGVAVIRYEVGALEPGTYYFRCVVHPAMTGEMEAAQGGDGGGDGGGGLTVVAQSLAFDVTEIALPADTPTTITMDNRDAGVLHNIAIYTDESASEVLFSGELVTGPTTVDYSIPPVPAGEAYFRCDVHPTMEGTVTIG